MENDRDYHTQHQPTRDENKINHNLKLEIEKSLNRVIWTG